MRWSRGDLGHGDWAPCNTQRKAVPTEGGSPGEEDATVHREMPTREPGSIAIKS